MFQEALDQPSSPPEGLDLYLFTGDAVNTGSVLTVLDSDNSIEVTDKQSGDGSILRSSALMDERLTGEWTPNLTSPIAWHDVNFIFKDHTGITSDHNFTDNLLYLLIESNR